MATPIVMILNHAAPPACLWRILTWMATILVLVSSCVQSSYTYDLVWADVLVISLLSLQQILLSTLGRGTWTLSIILIITLSQVVRPKPKRIQPKSKRMGKRQHSNLHKHLSLIVGKYTNKYQPLFWLRIQPWGPRSCVRKVLRHLNGKICAAVKA